MVKRPALSDYLAGLEAGDRVMLGRALTLIESKRREDEEMAIQLVQACLDKTGNAFRIGITGAPGAGKSTFIDALGSHITAMGKKVAVLAVDPSSSQTQGSILGDKTRMDRLSRDALAFIRPSPSGGNLGGVARNTREAMLLCEAAGFEVLLIETVGVGQSEIAVHGMTDFFLLLLLPNAGDELQGMKKGIVEMADGIFINKADGESLQYALQTQQQYSQAIRMNTSGKTWKPRILKGSSLLGEGIEEVWQMVLDFEIEMQAKGDWQKRRQHQALYWFDQEILSQIETLLSTSPYFQDEKQNLREQIAAGTLTPELGAGLFWESVLKKVDFRQNDRNA